MMMASNLAPRFMGLSQLDEKDNRCSELRNNMGLEFSHADHEPRTKTYIYINNRLEGNALLTLQDILAVVGAGLGR